MFAIRPRESDIRVNRHLRLMSACFEGKHEKQKMNPNEEIEIFVEHAKKRCGAVADRIESLPLSKITSSCKRTLLRLVNSELKFLSRFSSSSSSSSSSSAISVNIGYLESIVQILQQPYITGVSRVCKPIPFSSESGEKKNSHLKGVHVDIVCTLNREPVWFIVSDRNPKYISWYGSPGNKGLRTRIEEVLAVARLSLTLKPSLVILFFSNGLDGVVCQKLQDEFGASEFDLEFSIFNFYEDIEGEWVNILLRTYREAFIFQIKIDDFRSTALGLHGVVRNSNLGARTELPENQTEVIVGDTFCSLISRMKLSTLDAKSAKPEDLSLEDLINFDTTALIALVSGISNGGAEKLLSAPENEMRKRFRSNYEFVIAQVMSELRNPILVELGCIISGKRGMICETVHTEFRELVCMCGGRNEKLRADQLLKCLLIVPDCPSARIMGLLTTRKIALKNKVIFGTGDYWCSPTLTANMGFVRAISQTGMSLLTLEHRPRALTGD